MFAAWLILALPMLLNELMCEGALCDPKAEIECSDNNRTCNVLNNGKHECGSCQTGFLEYIMNDSLLRPLPNCVDIIDISWRKYISLYNPVYRDSQFDSLRQKSLVESAKLIKEHNSQVEYSTYMLGLTPFSADIDVDYGHRSGYFFVNVSGTDDELLAFEPMTWAAADIPKQIDWVSRGAVTLVKDQGRCACSWATGVSAVIEGAAYIADQFNESLSFQQFVSCNKRNLGCDGGSMPIAAKYSSENWFGGVTTSNAYPFEDYNGVTSFSCSLNALGGPSLAVEVSNLRSVAGLSGTITFDERLEIFKLALVETPISAIMKSSCVLFSNYFSGILTDDDGCACSDALCYDHTVLIVGYDDTGDVPFFRVKNSWGTGWGEDGYFRVAQIEKGKYGLFGLLGDGVVVNARQTKKVEAVEVVENPPFPLWLIVAIAFVGFLICCILISITYACWSRSRSEKVASV